MRRGGRLFVTMNHKFFPYPTLTNWTLRGGQDFSAWKSENSSAPLAPINNDRSLRVSAAEGVEIFLKRKYGEIALKVS